MEKVKKYLCTFLSLLLIFVFASFVASCDTNSPGENPAIVELENVVFEDVTIPYDGFEHSLSVANLPEGATVVYDNNGKIDSGEYTITANITYNGVNKKLTAKLNITKLDSILTADEEQFFYNQGIDRKISYQFNNKEQELSIEIYSMDDEKLDDKALYTPGKYKVSLTGSESRNYKASNKVWITVDIIESKYNVKFESENVIADGSEHVITATADLPEGYTLAYENNKGTTKGDYYAKAFVLDPNGNVVETQYAILSIDNPENPEFNEYLKEVLFSLFDQDQSGLNVFFDDFEAYGFERFPAIWYTYEKEEAESKEEIDADFEHDFNELESFDKATLSNKQQVAYDSIYELLFNAKKTAYNPDTIYMNMNYIDQFGGYVADLVSTLENYIIRTKEDIDDIISFINSSEEAFNSYYEYANDKALAGYPLSDYTLDKMIEYLNTISEQKTNRGYYLYDFLANKVNNFKDINDEEKSAYIERINTALDEKFMPAIEQLATNLASCKGKLEEGKEGYLSKYEGGSDIYKAKLESVLGFHELSGEKYIDELKKFLSKYNILSKNAVNTLVSKHKITTYMDITEYFNSNPVFDGTPLEMLEFLKEFASTIVKDLPISPEINIKEMDLIEAKNTNTVAYYRKSALGLQKIESITLNPILLDDDKLETLSTLAHEGYPGHLYSYVLSKQLGLTDYSIIFTKTGYGEGWATYVQIKLFEYLINNSTDEKQKDFLTYMYYNSYVEFIIYSMIDYYIFIEGYTVDDVKKLLNKYGYNKDAAEEIYNMIIEIPSQYSSYGYGKVVFVKIHDDAKKALSYYYDEIDYNMAIQSNGWTGLESLISLSDDYIAKQQFLHGIIK